MALRWLVIGLSFMGAGGHVLGSPATKTSVSCLGSTAANTHVIYLHGMEPPQGASREEEQNRQVLEQLASDLKVRVAMPRGPLCSGKGKHCWPAANRDEILGTWQDIKAQTKACWSGDPAITLIGFSNGGYFAWKLYKIHQDPQLRHIIASGSAGTWNSKQDKANAMSSFHLMIGTKDITRKEAERLSQILQRELPQFGFLTFAGGHRLDRVTLANLLGSWNETK